MIHRRAMRSGAAILSRVPELLQRTIPSLSRHAIHHPWRVLMVWGAVTLLALPGLLRLSMNTDGHALVPPGDPAILADARVRETFGLRDLLIVAIESRHPDGIFNPVTLGDAGSLTRALQDVPAFGREHVLSLGTERRDRIYPGSHESFATFLQPFPSSPELLSGLRHDLTLPSARLYTGTLVSEDRRMTAVLAGVPNGAGTHRRALQAQVAAFTASLKSPPELIRAVGAPAAEALLGEHIIRDLLVLVPLSVGVMATLIGLGTRRVACVLLTLAKASLCMLWTFGVMGWSGIPVFLPTAVLPVVLTTMSISDEIHLLLRFQHSLAEGATSLDAVDQTLRDLAVPVVLGTGTACAGFLAVLGSSIVPLASFGVTAALGIAYGMAFSLTVTPALLAVIPARAFARSAPARSRPWAWAPTKLLTLPIRHPRLVLGTLALVTVAAGAGAARLHIHDSWTDSFAKDSPFRRETEAVNASLNGTHLLHLHLAFHGGPSGGGDRGPLEDPRLVERLGEFEGFLRAQPGVGGVSGLHSHLRMIGAFWNLLPGEPRRILSRYELSPGLVRRRQVVNDSLDETVITVFLKNANYQDTQILLGKAEAYHREHLASVGARLAFAGDVAVSQAMIRAIVRAQILSLPLALCGVLALTLLLHGSLRFAIYALLPITGSAIWLLGGLGWLGVPLGIATSMFFAIALGLGVDSQSIHFLEAFRRLKSTGCPAPSVRALEQVGPPVLLNTATVAAGFGLLAVSSVPANGRLGLMIALALILGAVLSLAGLAALLTLQREDTTAASPAARPQHETPLS